MTRLLIATTNRDKLREIHSVLQGAAVELLTLADLQSIDEPDETGATFADNARLKVLHYTHAAARPISDPSLLIGLVSAAVLAVLGLAIANRTFQRESA